jgi:hypothetical protein
MGFDRSATQREQPKLRPPQFGLRTLMLVMTLLAVMLAMLRLEWLSPVGVALLTFLAVSIFAHMAGNCLGTRLRELSPLPAEADAERQTAFIIPSKNHFAPATKLSRRDRLGWLVLVATSIGATSGAVGGGLWTFLAARGHVGILPIAVGVLAFAVLGGLAAFAIFGFGQVLCGAIWQALGGAGGQATIEQAE